MKNHTVLTPELSQTQIADAVFNINMCLPEELFNMSWSDIYNEASEERRINYHKNMILWAQKNAKGRPADEVILNHLKKLIGYQYRNILKKHCE